MYNAEIKERFLDYYSLTGGLHDDGRADATVGKLKSLFEKLERCEKKHGKDICTMDVDILERELGNSLGLKSASIVSEIRLLKQYVSWCLTEDIPDACDAIFRVNGVGMSKIKKQMVASPKHLEEYLDRLFENPIYETISSVYMSYYWLAYMGIDQCDVFNIQSTDVDLNNMVVMCNGKAYKIYKEGYRAIRNAATLNRVLYPHPNYLGKVYVDRVSGTQLLRGLSKNTRESKSATLAKRFDNEYQIKRTQARKNVNEDDVAWLDLTYSRVNISGEFYRLYLEEMSTGIPVDSNRWGRRQKTGRYLDYIRWKETYHSDTDNA